jgi:hypothetical protein
MRKLTGHVTLCLKSQKRKSHVIAVRHIVAFFLQKGHITAMVAPNRKSEI